VPIVGVIENMSYLECPHCNEHINIFGRGGGQKISEKFDIPFLGEIPLFPQIMEGSDKGKPVIISDPDSIQANALRKMAKVTAGRISVIAAGLNLNEMPEDKRTSTISSISAEQKNGPSP
jgi:ATP-binding protein involved in chromosome partitioning